MANIDLDFFEKVIIKQCLSQDSSYLASIIDHLDKSLFKNDDIGTVIAIIKEFYLERNALPSITEIGIRCNSKGAKASVKAAVLLSREITDKLNDVELVHNTEHFLKQRKYNSLIERAIDEKARSKEFDLSEIQKESEKIHSITLVDNFGLDYFNDNERVVKYLQQKDSFISTGYSKLDEAFGGGFQKEGKAIYDIGGETNVGKSIFLANICLNVVLQNKNVVIISPEMSEMRYAKRISGMLTRIAISQLGENIAKYKEEVEKFKAKYQSKFIIKEVATKGMTPKNVQGFLKKLQDKRGIKFDLIAIDGHALFRPSVVQSNKHSELQYIVQEFRGLSYVFEAPVLSVAQLNRGSHKANNPGLDNMAGSWDQLSDFDAHVNIWQTDEDREANIIRFGGKKVRDGAKGGEGFLHIDYETLKLSQDEEGGGQFDPNTPVGELQDLLNLHNNVDPNSIDLSSIDLVNDACK